MDRILKFASVSLICNIVFSSYHIIFGVSTRSVWLFTIGIYYAILSAVRFTVLRPNVRKRFAIRFTGIMLIALSLPLVGTVILSFTEERGTAFDLIFMLAVAVYAFAKITIATVNLIRARKIKPAKLVALRNIAFADAFVSIFSLQRSMLVSFDGMAEKAIKIMNLSTGSAVCFIVFLLGLNLLLDKKGADNDF